MKADVSVCVIEFILWNIQLKFIWDCKMPLLGKKQQQNTFNPSHAAIKILINATAAEFICKNIFPIPWQVKKIIKNKIGDIQQIYLYQNVCK